MYAKLYHNKRPGIWTSIDEYMKLHLGIQSLCNPPEPMIHEVTVDLHVVTNGNVGNIENSESIENVANIDNGGPSNDCIRVPPEGMEIDSAAI